MNFPQIIDKIKRRDFAPVYLLMGQEPFYIDQITDAIENSVMEEEQRSFNQEVLYGKEAQVDSIVSSARTYPFGTEKRVVIIKEAKELKGVEQLGAYAEAPSPSTILVIAYKYGKFTAKQTKPFEKQGIVFNSEKIKDYNLAKWVQTQATSHSYLLSDANARLLAEHIGNDLSRIDNEFVKLSIFLPKGSEITSDIIEKHIGISKEYNVFELQEALGERNITRAYAIALNFVNHIKENPNVKTIASLASFYTKMLAYQLSDKTQDSSRAIFGNLPPFILDKNCRNAQSYSLLELRKIIATLREYDLKSKGVDNIAPDEQLLRELIYKITH